MDCWSTDVNVHGRGGGAGSHIQLNSMNVSVQGLMETLAGSFNNPLEWLDKVVVAVKQWGGCDFIGLHQVCHWQHCALHPQLVREVRANSWTRTALFILVWK